MKMLDFLIGNTDTDAVVLLENDHKLVKGLFRDFEKATTAKQKKKIADEVIQALKVHAAIEEGIFYPAVRGTVGNKEMNEADEEHHVAKLLIAELERMDGTEDHFDAKVTVLAENIRHHIREEESEMMPKARLASIDFAKLGQTLLDEKTRLEKDGVPTFTEERVVKLSRGKTDSPAETARALKRAKAKARAKAPKKKAKTAAKARPSAGKKKTVAAKKRRKTAR
jgi:hemerythrin superfamily protein